MIEHCINPNGPHLRACGDPVHYRDLHAGSFIALLVFPERHDLCRKCRLVLIGMLLCDHGKVGTTSDSDNCTLVLTDDEKAFLKKWYAVTL